MQMKCISMFRNNILLLALLSLTSCAHYSFDPFTEKKTTLSVPYAKGDDTGDLTNALINSISTKTHFRVEEDCRYQLIVEILHSKRERLAYRFNPLHKERLISCENRANMLAQVTIVDRTTKKTIRGPGFIRASIDYDHQSTAKDDTINKYSLGQLGNIDTYGDSLPIPLFRDLSEKIALWVEQQYTLLPFDRS